MNEMVERVARALCRSKRNGPLGTYPAGWVDRHVDEHWPMFTVDAIIAIGTMREPTEAMNEAGFSAACRHDNGDTVPSLEIAPATFKAMIDEALK